MAFFKLNLKDIYNWSAQGELISKLQEWRVLAAEGCLKCDRCGALMRLCRLTCSADGYAWRCVAKVRRPKSKPFNCRKARSLRFSTFFQNSKLTLEQIVVFCFLWVHNMEQEFIKDEIRITSRTSTDWNSFCHEVIMDFCLRREKPIGGQDMTVEIDEAKFEKIKYHKGHLVEGQLMVGGICRETGDIFMVPADGRDASTLILLIENWIVPGSTLISDFWKEYNGIDETTFMQLKVNHSVSFEDTETGPTGNTGNGLWRYAKRRLPEYNRGKCSSAGYFAKFLFMQFCSKQKLDPTVEFFRAAGQLYNPYNQDEESEDGTQDSDNSCGEGPSNEPGQIPLSVQIKEEELSFSEEDDNYS